MNKRDEKNTNALRDAKNYAEEMIRMLPEDPDASLAYILEVTYLAGRDEGLREANEPASSKPMCDLCGFHVGPEAQCPECNKYYCIGCSAAHGSYKRGDNTFDWSVCPFCDVLDVINMTEKQKENQK